MSYQIISDSSCDLGIDLAAKHNVEIVPFYVTFDNTNYKKEILEVEVRDFYQKMVENPKVFPKSSLPSIQDYVEVFTKYAKQGIDVICICITTKFSGSYNSATNAKRIVQEDYPDCHITVIDSMINTVLQGIYVLEAVKMRDQGLTYDEAVANLERIKTTGRIFFTVGGMEYLKSGGRIGKVIGLAGSTLGIRPLITLKEGEIFPSGISRSRRKSLTKTVNLVVKHFETTKENPKDYILCIGYGYDVEEAKEFKQMVIEALKPMVELGDLLMLQIGAAIGVHTGPYPLGVGLLKKYDV